MHNIKLNDILGLSNDEILNSKIELNMQAGNGGEAYINLWLYCSDMDKINGTCPECGYWGWYGKNRNFSPGQWVFSFVRIRENEWLFTSAAEVIEVPENTWAKVKIFDKYKPYFGRLVIKLVKGNTFARYTFNLSKYIDNSNVKEILPSLYGGENFPGYDKVRVSFKQLESIIKSGKSDWIAALENQKAVYLLTDKSNGKMYVGSATSDYGMLLQRWRSYVTNGHGGNVELQELVKNKGFDYIKANFHFSILENYNAKVDDQVVLERESWWKETLQTRIFGYNNN
ncbi:MAG TPA: GIY-YIG nuclease family protein [Bacillota bacterium]|jgi:hypothetical protein|nr:GIY-YIG nuclease family protein [Bacillota bacterium]